MTSDPACVNNVDTWLFPASRRSVSQVERQIFLKEPKGCPKKLLEEAMDTPNGVLVRRCFRILNAKSMGLAVTLADITEEEFRVMELIEAQQKEHIAEFL